MATGATLESLIEEVQYELGHTVSASVGQNFRDHIAARIKREYKRLYDDFHWPFLLSWQDVAVVAGTNTYTLPTVSGAAAKLSDVVEVYTLHGNHYLPVERGLCVTDYNAFNPASNERSDPVLKWEPRSETTFEVWPEPASAGSLRLVVKKPFVQLANEAATCLIDDDLVVLHAAAILLQRQGSKEAPSVFARAEQHYRTLKQRLQTGATKVRLGGGREAYDPRQKVFVGVTPGEP